MAAYYARCCGEDADDLTQEAWAGLLEALPELDLSIGSPEQYLIKRARWRLLDSVKRARIRRCESLDEAAWERGSTWEREAPGEWEYDLAGLCVAEFASALRTPQRAVLKCLLAGLTWREAGAALGCTSANVAYYVRQIKQRYEEWVGGCP